MLSPRGNEYPPRTLKQQHQKLVRTAHPTSVIRPRCPCTPPDTNHTYPRHTAPGLCHNRRNPLRRWPNPTGATPMISGVSGYSSYSYSSTASSRSSSSSSTSATSCVGGSTDAQEKLFKLLDSNSDGSVDKDELSTALNKAHESDSSLGSIDIDDLFAQLDANSDGSIDQDETAAMAPPPPPGGPSGPNPQELFASLDSDEDGGLSLDKSKALAGPPPPPPPSANGSDSANSTSTISSDSD